MASANVTLVRSIVEAWERGEFGSVEWADPEIDFVIADGPAAASWKGIAEMAGGWRDFLGSWEGFRVVPEAYRELDGGRVLLLLGNTGRGKTSGLDLGEIRTKSANLFEIRDGKVTRLVAYWDRDRALDELGVAGESDSASAATSRGTAPADSEIGEVLVEADALEARVRELGAEISRDYEGRDLLLVGILKGAVFFLSDLMRALTVPCEVDFMALASYGSSTDSSGVVRILKDLDAPIEGRDVVIVEDIVDSGLTLSYLLRTLEARQPASLEVCALLTKPERRKVELPIRYVGFEIENRFVIGYGLDHAQRFRNLPYVAVLNEG
jgi:hypoxanthine phosphoribosyltransferase